MDTKLNSNIFSLEACPLPMRPRSESLETCPLPRPRSQSVNLDQNGNKTAVQKRTVDPTRWLDARDREHTRPAHDFTFEEFCSRLQIHGLLDWYQARSKVSAVFWIFMIFVFLFITILTIYNCVDEYYTDPILTTVAIRTTNAMPFPVVSICPCNYVNWSHPRALEIESLVGNFYQHTETEQQYGRVLPEIQTDYEHLVSVLPPPFQAIRDDVNCTDDDCVDFAPPPFDLSNIVSASQALKTCALETNQFLKSCSFMTNSIECSEYAKPIVDQEHGLCWQIDLRGAVQLRRRLGLRLLIDIHADNDVLLNDVAKTSTVEGVTIKVHKRGTPIADEVVLAQPGNLVKVELSKSKQHLINLYRGETHQRCTDKDKEPKFAILNATYSRDACELDCIYNEIYRHCDCIMRVDPLYVQDALHSERFCSKDEDSQCIQDYTSSTRDDAKLKTCTDQCEVSCQQDQYEMTQSALKFPSLPILAKARKESEYIPPDIHPGRWQENYIILDIAFGRMEYFEYTQNPSTSITDMISDIGGNAGLWLGASMLTFVQFVALMMNWLYSKYSR